MIHWMAGMKLKSAAVVVAAFLSPSALLAQGCAMCYQSAASSGSQFIQALRHGILIMFFPPILIMGLIYYAAYLKRNQFNASEHASIAGNDLSEDVPPEWSVERDGNLLKLTKKER